MPLFCPGDPAGIPQYVGSACLLWLHPLVPRPSHLEDNGRPCSMVPSPTTAFCLTLSSWLDWAMGLRKGRFGVWQAPL